MILIPGDWLGRGSILVHGTSLGSPLEAAMTVSQTDAETLLTGTLSGKLPADAATHEDGHSVSIRIIADEWGTYVVEAHLFATTLSGTAKLDSIPALSMLWTEEQGHQVSCALFELRDGGFGCRGFFRREQAQFSWEIAFHLKQRVLKGDNVVSLAGRRNRS